MLCFAWRAVQNSTRMTKYEAKRLLAAWRREGHGVWQVRFVVEGWDDTFTYLAPGKLSKGFAVEMCRQQCANELGESTQFIHLQIAFKEP